jgi:HlyD family secretion protein
MSDPKALLSQLKIDRSAAGAAPRARGARWRWPALGLGVVAAAAAAVWLWRAPPPPALEAATARAVATHSAASGGSVLDASGYVIARRQATVSSKVTGKITEVRIEEGQRVAAGEVLARIDDANVQAQRRLAEAQLQAARAQREEIEVQLAEADRSLARNRELLAVGFRQLDLDLFPLRARNRELLAKRLVSQAAFDAAEASRDGLRARLASAEENVAVAEAGVAVQRQALEDTVIRAPFDAVVTVKNAQPGEMISPLSAGGDGTRTGIGTLVDMGSLEIEVDVNENFINRVVPGQAVTARLNAYPELSFPAAVIAVVPTADRSKATVKVRVGLEQPDPRVLPQMGVRVSFLETAPPEAVPAASSGVLIPARARAGDSVWVWREGVVERRRLGETVARGDALLVQAGLATGERVILDPPADLVDGQRVRLHSPQ